MNPRQSIRTINIKSDGTVYINHDRFIAGEIIYTHYSE